MTKIDYLRAIRLSIASITPSNPSRTASVVAVTAVSTAAAAFFRAAFSLALTLLTPDLTFLSDDVFFGSAGSSSVTVEHDTEFDPPPERAQRWVLGSGS